jgi:ankyrin repeat protein
MESYIQKNILHKDFNLINFSLDNLSIANQSAYYVNALKKRQTDIAKSILYSPQFSLLIKDRNGWDAGFYAIVYDNTEILNILIYEKKLDVNSVDYKGYSLLMIAVKYNRYKIVKILIKNGARINQYHSGINKIGYYVPPNYATAYSIAKNNRYKNIMNLLLFLGADSTLTDRYLKTFSIFEDSEYDSDSDKFNFCKLG